MAGLFTIFTKRTPSYHSVGKQDESEYRDSDTFASSTEGLISHEQKPVHEGSRSRKWLAPVIHLFFLITYTIAYVILVRRGIIAARSCEHVVHSPAYEAVVKEAIEYQGQLRIVSPYQGVPSPEVDQAWKELLQYSNIRVTGEDLRKINKTSIEVPGEKDSYWVELSVVHELHCIKRLRQYWFSDYYFPNITDEDRRLNWLHNGTVLPNPFFWFRALTLTINSIQDHCLEILRQSVMCHADVSMMTMTWEPTSVFPAADFQNLHECTNWDRLYEWQKERSVDMMKPGYLVHPYLGVPFPEGHYDGVGAADPDHAIGTEGERPDELLEMGIRESNRRKLRARNIDE